MGEKYRRLEKGEIIQEGDEFDNCANPWHDEPKWIPVNEQSIGTPASDPNFVAHCKYRRKVG